MPAETLEEIFLYFHNKPMDVDEFDKFYVDADKGRGKPCYSRLKRRLSSMPNGNLKYLLAGHRGCGKSTELIRLQKSIQNDFVILNFSVVRELDVINLNYIELFIATMEILFSFINKETQISIDNEHIKNIQNWLQSAEIEEINQNYMGMDIETGIKANAKIPFIAEFFAKFRAAAKTSASLKKTLKKRLEPRLSELIGNCNILINEIKKQLPVINKKGLLIIIEDLDKVDMQTGEDIFYVHSTQLTELDCHCVFTYPIALLYHIKSRSIKTSYEENLVLPMIKVHEKDHTDCDEGISVMKAIVENRMDVSLFENDDILTQMIRKSGGCLLDLFVLIKEAADNALDAGRERINLNDFSAAVLSLKNDYELTIAEDKEKGITVDQYYDALVECTKDVCKKPAKTDILKDLMNNLTVLNYNGEGWHDVHPVVRDILKDKGLLADD